VTILLGFHTIPFLLLFFSPLLFSPLLSSSSSAFSSSSAPAPSSSCCCKPRNLIGELLGQLSCRRDGKHQGLANRSYDAFLIILHLAPVHSIGRDEQTTKEPKNWQVIAERTRHLCRSGRAKVAVLPVPVCEEHTT